LITYAIIAEDAEQSTPTGTGGAGGAGGGGGTQLLVMMGVIFAVFYLLIIRPQQKKEKTRQRTREEMLKAIKKSDHVQTIGGIHGIVASVTEDEVVLKVDEQSNTRIRFSRDAISRVITAEEAAGDEKRLSDKPGENR
jgi:preprotein translocase subunit YajC